MDVVGRIMSLFRGLEEAHGTYDTETKSPGKVKSEIKASARTLRQPVTDDLWKQHLAGTRPLGVVPINKENMCYWGVIDIDKYDLDYPVIIAKFKKYKMPLVPCRSKSGGIHAFLFLSEPTDAKTVIAVLKGYAAKLGFAESEVFPKQAVIQFDRGDLGNWLNMPYYGGDQTNRYGLREDGGALTMLEFLSRAEALRTSPDTLFEIPQAKEKSEWSDGPPCLEHLASIGIEEGGRNNALFNLGVFAKKKYPADWETKISSWNHELMQTPLPIDEVLTVVKGLKKDKEYNYSCKTAPICNFCDRAKCNMRKYGVGMSGSYPDITGITKLNSTPILWFVALDNEYSVQLTTEELHDYGKFSRRALEVTHRLYNSMKADAWNGIINKGLENLQVVDPPPELTDLGQYLMHLRDLLTEGNTGAAREELHLDIPVYIEDEDVYEVTPRTVNQYLHKVKFNADAALKNRAIEAWDIKSISGEVKGKSLRRWKIRGEFVKEGTARVSAPKIKEDPV